MLYAKGTVEICILCDYALQRSIYVCIEKIYSSTDQGGR